jgi:hypothetical protein
VPDRIVTSILSSTVQQHRGKHALAHIAAWESGERKGVFIAEKFKSDVTLTLQLPFCLEVRALGDGLVSSAPEGPRDGVCGLNPLSIKSDGNAANFLD